ncbi:Uncharacterized conserved protein YndB, AHSA1/START domain [Flavobacteriaceae bacterium MAR_2010_188]|nr:Uncharacterized conserved protein YndB, AHSA1/START domain [Flavobacteriaceae bacterium MAR_2010_188]
MNTNPIIVEKEFLANSKTLWEAITKPEQMKQWYFNIPKFKAEEGFRFQFVGGPSEDEQYIHQCEILIVQPERLLKHSWSYQGYSGESYLTFELIPNVRNTTLRLTHENLESFPDTNPAFARKNFVEGWDQIINHSLLEFIKRNK